MAYFLALVVVASSAAVLLVGGLSWWRPLRRVWRRRGRWVSIALLLPSAALWVVVALVLFPPWCGEGRRVYDFCQQLPVPQDIESQAKALGFTTIGTTVGCEGATGWHICAPTTFYDCCSVCVNRAGEVSAKFESD